MRLTLLAFATFALSSSAFGQFDQMCRDRALDAYNRAYNDCMYGGGGGTSCSYYTPHGEYACRDHAGCNWSYVSNQCYDTTGPYCESYTIHGEYACRDNPRCNWSYVSNSCYER